MMRVAIHGAGGRMGRAVAAMLAEDPDAKLVGAIEARHAPTLGKDLGELAGVGTLGVEVSHDVPAGLLGADVVIDFSTAAAVPALLHAAMRAKVAVVSGTTRLDATAERLLDEAAKLAPVMWAPNMSFGVHVLAHLSALATRMLGPSFDIEIVETHHRAKVDAPSGTANRLADAIATVRPSAAHVHGRAGEVGPRKDDEVGMLALRGGDVIGDHTVHFLGQGERLELTHRATSRVLFARGAVAAAHILVGRAPGRYTMDDVVAATLGSAHTSPPDDSSPDDKPPPREGNGRAN
jgi:4-hydroxy-tetrahydrodipicolinate reductase